MRASNKRNKLLSAAYLLRTITNVNTEHLVATTHAEVQSYTVLICTANRSNEIRVALNSLVDSGIGKTRVIVVDQSETDATQEIIYSYLSTLQLTYIRTKTKGKCAAANLAMRYIKTEFVVMLDDDCAATPGWSEALLDAMLTHDDVAVVYGTVAPAFVCPGGFIPEYLVPREFIVTNWLQKCRARGIGANCAYRKSYILAVGGFNEAFGPGSRFRSCSDGELSLRCISKGFHIMETPNSTVIHYGFRTFSQGRMLAYNSFFGIAASCLQTTFKGHPGAVLVLLDEIITHALWPTLISIFRLRPTGLSRITGFIGGLLAMTVYTIQGFFGSDDDQSGGSGLEFGVMESGFALTDAH
jgi:glycosyltransferase involved in cell wall biosynthesis